MSETMPKLAFCGSTGAGKSSLINALMRAQVCKVGVTSTTRDEQECETVIGEQGLPVYLVDTPGLAEAGRHEEYAAHLLEALPRIDMLLWVVGYDNRALDLDKQGSSTLTVELGSDDCSGSPRE